MGQIVRKLNAWCSNMVQRHGLRYVLVPERHKDGAIHFHGFFDDSLEAVDSGTIRLPGSKKPRKPRSKKERSEWLASGGQVVYNLPAWTLGYTTALQVYGEYPAAVAYVCKYIGKQGDKPAGRWYYSGGQLVDAAVEYVELSPAELAKEYPGTVGFCWDTGHEMCYNYSKDMLALYGDLLIATHINDNLGIKDYDGRITYLDDLHLLPFDGVKDWSDFGRRMKKTGYQGELTFELKISNQKNRHENDVYLNMPFEQYLTEAYKRACRVAVLVQG
jgi:hypothetical protein